MISGAIKSIIQLLQNYKAQLKVKLGYRFKTMFYYTLYLKMSMFISCVAIICMMMLIGFFFLLDYIPASQSAIQSLAQRKLEWSLALTHADMDIAPSAWKESVLAGQSSASKWFARYQEKRLGSEIAELKAREIAIRAESDVYKRQMFSSLIIKNHDALISEINKDVEEKQTVLVMLQIVGLLLLVLCLAAMSLSLRSLLVDRLTSLLEILPGETFYRLDNKKEDEFSHLENKVHEVAAQIQVFKTESEWFNKTKSELLRRLLRARQFIHTLVFSFQDQHINEASIKTIVYNMENSLDLKNVTIRFVLKEGEIHNEKIIFSQYELNNIPNNILVELTTEKSVRFKLQDNVECIAVSFTCPGDSFGLLTLEAKEGQEFYDSDVTLAEITGQLFSMVMGDQSREEEARRLALYEERAAIARELHDSLAQSLSFMKIQLSRLQTHEVVQQGQLGKITNELMEGLDTAYKGLRELLSTFRMHMDVRGLGYAIQAAIDEFSNRSSLAITFDNRLVNCRLTVNEEFHILHVIREALSNIIRHAEASSVYITISYTQGSTVIVTVDDDGVGISKIKEEFGHYGQSIMRDRAYSLGGEISVTAKRKGGTRVKMVFTPKMPQ